MSCLFDNDAICDENYNLKEKKGEFQIYFGKIPLHQQKILMVLVLFNLPSLPRNFKKCPK